MMLPDLRSDRALLDQLLAARRAVTVETLPPSARRLWSTYLLILEDAVKIVRALVDFLEARR